MASNTSAPADKNSKLLGANRSLRETNTDSSLHKAHWWSLTYSLCETNPKLYTCGAQPLVERKSRKIFVRHAQNYGSVHVATQSFRTGLEFVTLAINGNSQFKERLLSGDEN
ncbi:hypothetical protein TNCV_381511 [Trichonephila clavipes]|uniref:Uncharacterized protein n=1 Tax=Trichonephila clavipes TaxID=2585209 RepID=A0A8X6SAP8_TRICX|nr:hypothetical protein TNCV_381511 [Trichonephila clavipes]